MIWQLVSVSGKQWERCMCRQRHLYFRHLVTLNCRRHSMWALRATHSHTRYIFLFQVKCMIPTIKMIICSRFECVFEFAFAHIYIYMHIVDCSSNARIPGKKKFTVDVVLRPKIYDPTKKRIFSIFAVFVDQIEFTKYFFHTTRTQYFFVCTVKVNVIFVRFVCVARWWCTMYGAWCSRTLQCTCWIYLFIY